MSTDEDFLKQQLGTSLLKSTGVSGGGCISQGSAYETDFGTVFIKVNSESKALGMFEGEFSSLKAIASTSTVKVPKPIKVLSNPKGGAMLVMEYLHFDGLRKQQSRLGELMARLHLHNPQLKSKTEKASQSVHYKSSSTTTEDDDEGENNEYVSQFGFHMPTCCGYLSQDNLWMDSWQDFFIRKIDQNVKRCQEKCGDREVSEVWSSLVPHLPKLFIDINVEPSLLHGDLWGGNAGETDQEPVIFDPASFYGHSEFDLAISTMFGGFGKAYFSSYHSVIPKEKGFDERQDLYCMFHYLNHWNHFGSGYKSSTLQLLRSLKKRLM